MGGQKRARLRRRRASGPDGFQRTQGRGALAALDAGEVAAQGLEGVAFLIDFGLRAYAEATEDGGWTTGARP